MRQTPFGVWNFGERDVGRGSQGVSNEADAFWRLEFKAAVVTYLHEEGSNEADAFWRLEFGRARPV